jgi:hypothetical protein
VKKRRMLRHGSDADSHEDSSSDGEEDDSDGDSDSDSDSDVEMESVVDDSAAKGDRAPDWHSYGGGAAGGGGRSLCDT